MKIPRKASPSGLSNTETYQLTHILSLYYKARVTVVVMLKEGVLKQNRDEQLQIPALVAHIH